MNILKFKGFVLNKNDNRLGSIETFVDEDGMLIQGFHNGTDIHIKPYIYNDQTNITTLAKTLKWYNKSKKKLEVFCGSR